MRRWLVLVLGVLASCDTETPATNGRDAAVLDASIRDSRPEDGPPDQECAPKVVADAPVPAAYAGKTSPLDPDDALVMTAGQMRFLDRCAICHGESGRGDGRGGPYNPPTADLTTRLRPEDYLFWRISEGGYTDPFCTAMPAFSKIFTERQRWELVAYVRTLAGAGDAGADASD